MRIDFVNQKIKDGGIIAIFRGEFSVEELLRMADALLKGNVNILEITLNSPAALNALPNLRDKFDSEMLIGAGTVRDKQQAQQASDAGAQFLVSPNLDMETVSFTQRQDLLHIPGVFTSTEIQEAYAAGCRMLKLFPMDGLANGVKYLKAIRAPFQDIDFIPTGGISLENISDYAHAGAAAVGLGSHLIGKPGHPLNDLIKRAQALRNAWEQAKHA